LALAPNAVPDKFDELASRQKEAAEFAGIYHDTLSSLGAPAEAVELMKDALEKMKSAGGALAERKREPALPAEEKALADLYQVLKHLPRLGDLPTQPPPPKEQQSQQDPAVNVALQAIKKQKKEPPSNEELAQALEEAKQLSRTQAGLLQAAEQP